MDFAILAALVAAHGAFNDDPLAPPEAAPPVPPRVVVQRAHDDTAARERDRQRRAAAAAAHGAQLLQRAKPGDRNVIVAFATTHCRPCDALLRWLDEPRVKHALAADYAIVVVDHDEAGASDLCAVYSGDAVCAGYPVVVVVDARGRRLSRALLGYPESVDETWAFVATLARAAKHIDASAQADLVRALQSERDVR